MEESPYDNIRTSDYPHIRFYGPFPHLIPEKLFEGPEGEELKRKLARFSAWLREQKRLEAERERQRRRCPRCGWPLESTT